MEAIRDLVLRRFPGRTIVSCARLGDDEQRGDATSKGSGYGVPVRIVLRDAAGHEDKTWAPQEGLFHEILNEPSYRDLSAGMAAWISARS